MHFSGFKTILCDNYEDSFFMNSLFWWIMHLLSLELDTLRERIIETALVWFRGSKLYFSIFIKVRYMLKLTFQNGWQKEWFTYSYSKVNLVYLDQQQFVLSLCHYCKRVLHWILCALCSYPCSLPMAGRLELDVLQGPLQPKLLHDSIYKLFL